MEMITNNYNMEEIKLQNFKNLLSQVSEISKKYAEIAEITGANYNIFNVLDVATKEVRTHSAFIADLLNPKGLHGKGDVFLKLFVDTINNKLPQEKQSRLILKDSCVTVEESIGKISGDEGGRIDIVIKDNENSQIVIENKIYAGDQYKQLVRYHNKYPNAILLYLTLFEKEASEESTKKEDKTTLIEGVDYFNITYKKDIKEWLTECHKETANHPLLRETLTQYINLIKQLTGQTMNDEMNKNIRKIVISNLEDAKLINNAYNDINNSVSQKLDTIFLLIENEELIKKSSNKVKITRNRPGAWRDLRIFHYRLENNRGYILVQLVKKDTDLYIQTINNMQGETFEPNKKWYVFNANISDDEIVLSFTNRFNKILEKLNN